MSTRITVKVYWMVDPVQTTAEVRGACSGPEMESLKESWERALKAYLLYGLTDYVRGAFHMDVSKEISLPEFGEGEVILRIRASTMPGTLLELVRTFDHVFDLVNKTLPKKVLGIEWQTVDEVSEEDYWPAIPVITRLDLDDTFEVKLFLNHAK